MSTLSGFGCKGYLDWLSLLRLSEDEIDPIFMRGVKPVSKPMTSIISYKFRIYFKGSPYL